MDFKTSKIREIHGQDLKKKTDNKKFNVTHIAFLHLNLKCMEIEGLNDYGANTALTKSPKCDIVTCLMDDSIYLNVSSKVKLSCTRR